MTPPAPRLRFAPSPTGYLHVGNARAALFNWLEARRVGGEMLLRVEDTDRERSSSDLVENILASLRWLGLDWDGDIVFQADHLDAHREAALHLLATGRAYWCDCTSEAVQARAKARGGPPGYDGFCRDRGLERNDATALRFRAPDDGTTSFTDLVRGEVSFENSTIEDFVLLRSSGLPVFLLSNAWDDAAMGITHVVRGEDHLPGTPKYLLLRAALDLGRPEVFAHLPMLVNEKRQKLSKRKGDAVVVADFATEGYLPEAMVNYLALLGWGPKDGVEVRPLEEIVELFRLTDVTSSPAFFDIKKLQSFNADHLRALPVAEFVDRARPFISGPEVEAVLRPIAPLIQERVRVLTEVEPMVAFLLEGSLVVDDESWSKVVNGKAAPEMLDASIELLATVEPWTAEPIRAAIEAAAVKAGLVNAEGQPQLSKAQGPVRVAVTGRSVGPPLFESLEALGRDRSLDRLREARARL